MSVADVIRPANEGNELDGQIAPNCSLINEVTVCDDPAISPNFAAYSFGPYAYVNLAVVNLLYWLWINKITIPKFDGEPARYLYYWVWLTALLAVDIPFAIPALLYPFIFIKSNKTLEDIEMTEMDVEDEIQDDVDGELLEEEEEGGNDLATTVQSIYY